MKIDTYGVNMPWQSGDLNDIERKSDSFLVNSVYFDCTYETKKCILNKFKEKIRFKGDTSK